MDCTNFNNQFTHQTENFVPLPGVIGGVHRSLQCLLFRRYSFNYIAYFRWYFWILLRHFLNLCFCRITLLVVIYSWSRNSPQDCSLPHTQIAPTYDTYRFYESQNNPRATQYNTWPNNMFYAVSSLPLIQKPCVCTSFLHRTSQPMLWSISGKHLVCLWIFSAFDTFAMWQRVWEICL